MKKYKVPFRITIDGQPFEQGEQIISASSPQVAEEQAKNDLVTLWTSQEKARDIIARIGCKGLIGIFTLKIDLQPATEFTGEQKDDMLEFLKSVNAPAQIIRQYTEMKSPSANTVKEHPLVEELIKANASNEEIKYAQELVAKIPANAGLQIILDGLTTVLHKSNTMKAKASSGKPSAFCEMPGILFATPKDFSNIYAGLESILGGKIRKPAACQADKAHSDILKAIDEITKALEYIKEQSLGTCRINGRPAFIVSHDEATGHTRTFTLGGFNTKSELNEFIYQGGISAAPVSSWKLKSKEAEVEEPA